MLHVLFAMIISIGLLQMIINVSASQVIMRAMKYNAYHAILCKIAINAQKKLPALLVFKHLYFH